MQSTYQVLNLISLSRKALSHNYNYFAARHRKSQIAPVIKANAYGHGLLPVASFIQDELPSVPFVCVDSLYEAYELTKGGVTLPCLILGYTNPANYQVRKQLPYIFGISDITSLKILGQSQPRARIHLSFETGMSRLGFGLQDIPEIVKIIAQHPKLRIEGIYSHFAAADNPKEDSFTRLQLARFKECIALFAQAGITFVYRHMSATAGSEVVNDPVLNLIRLGLGFYGYSPFGPRTTEGLRQRSKLRPALTLTSHIAHQQELSVGDTVGYGRTYRAKQQESIATLPLGYHEGVSRSLGNHAVVTIGRTQCPIIGNISMNMMTIKIPRTHALSLNDPVTIISPDPQAANSVYSIAKISNTIPYTVITGLHSSIRRVLV